MKKFYLFLFALVGFTSWASAATIDDVAVCRHSYAFVADDYTNNGTTARVKGNLFGDGFFLDVTGGSIAANKGSVDLTAVDSVLVTPEISQKYGEYGKHLNSLRLKNDQDVIAMKVTAKSKLIIFYQNNNADRYPLFGSTATVSKSKLTVQGEKCATVNKTARIEWTAPDDMTVYIGSQGGDMYVSYIFVEANEAPGTPTVKVGKMAYDGLWYKEVTCKANPINLEGDDYPTLCTYTTDGSTPNEKSPVYKEPIKCYKDMEVKFQAYLDYGHGAEEENICENADNSGIVSFSFDNPSISADGANVTITSPYEGATNYYSTDGAIYQAGSTFTLSESATVSAYSEIVNGTYATFTTKTASKDVYVLNPITERVELVATGDAKDSVDVSTGNTVYYIQNGNVEYDKMQFFIKNMTISAIANADATNSPYQVPQGKEAYIQMSNTNITFQVAEGDSVDVTVTTSRNSCKTLFNEDSTKIDRKVYVNVSGKTYGNDDITNGDPTNLAGYNNVIKFGLPAGTYTFQKYSGTGNIHLSSIEIEPAKAGPEPVEPFEEEYIAAVYDTITKKGVMAPEYLAVVDSNGVATNVVDHQSRFQVATDHMTVEVVGGATVAKNTAEMHEGKGDQITEDGTVLAWNDITWKPKQNGDLKFAYVEGTGNPHVGIYAVAVGTDWPGAYTAKYYVYEPDGSKGLPQTGIYYKFSPSADGVVTARVWINKGNRKFYIVDAETGLALDTTMYSAEGYANGVKVDGVLKYQKLRHGVEPIKDSQTGDTIGWKPTYVITYCTYNADGSINKTGQSGQPLFCWLTFPVKAGKNYLMFNDNSQVGFGGYKFSNGGAAGLKGDANDDGVVDVADITAIASYILGTTPSTWNADNADANNDSVIDVADITATATIILK